MSNGIGELVERATARLGEMGYSKSARNTYVAAWREFGRWCEERAISLPADGDAAAFLAERGWPPSGSCHAASKGRAVTRLLALAGRGDVPVRARPEPQLAPSQFQHLYDGYLATLRGRGLSERTLARVGSGIRSLLGHLDECGVASASGTEARHVLSHIGSFGSLAASTRAHDLRSIRAFLSYAAAEHGLDARLASPIPSVCSDADDVLPSVYTASEVGALIAAARAAKGPTAKRDLAFVMLAATVGMRAGDIKGLTFGQISWDGRSVGFAQRKTGKRVVLPLPDECLLAIADYIANERPESPDEHVFLRSVAPHVPLSDGYAIHGSIARLMAEAGIDARGRHHGAHSLRHSAAVNMLSSGTRYPVLAGILGHEFANTTKRYLRVDVEALRPMCLEVPDA